MGSLWGRCPICRGTKKTLEGTAAAVAATLAAWALLLASAASAGHAGGAGGSSSSGSSGDGGFEFPGGQLAAGLAGGWVPLAAATALSCLLEAVTTQLDNIFMPLHYFALLAALE